MKTLPDYIRPGLDILSVGLNPSLPSVRDGFYFANPRNRFWKALNASGLVPVQLEPGIAATDILYREYGIGFTDVVKRPTAGGADLRAADYREWAPKLAEKLALYAPRIVWFQGKQAYSNYLRYGMEKRLPIEWGEQPVQDNGTRVFVTPNPSPANATFSLDDLTQWFHRLALLRDSLAAEADS